MILSDNQINVLKTIRPEYSVLSLEDALYNIQMDYEYGILNEEEYAEIMELFNQDPTYVAIRVCIGTEPYITSRLEMDTRDIVKTLVVLESELDEYDVVRKIGTSKSKKYLEEMAREEERCRY